MELSGILQTLKDIESMDCYKGPLGSHRNYIAHIALPNCIDYLQLVKSNREQGRKSHSDQYREFRYFISAVESLNNILDYMYFEVTESPKWSRKGCREFRERHHTSHLCLGKINKIANAYKHCILGDDKGKRKLFKERKNALHARDLAMCQLYFTSGMRVGRPLVEVRYSFDGIDNEELIGEVFRFWVSYINNDSV